MSDGGDNDFFENAGVEQLIGGFVRFVGIVFLSFKVLEVAINSTGLRALVPMDHDVSHGVAFACADSRFRLTAP